MPTHIARTHISYALLRKCNNAQFSLFIYLWFLTIESFEFLSLVNCFHSLITTLHFFNFSWRKKYKNIKFCSLRIKSLETKKFGNLSSEDGFFLFKLDNFFFYFQSSLVKKIRKNIKFWSNNLKNSSKAKKTQKQATKKCQEKARLFSWLVGT